MNAEELQTLQAPFKKKYKQDSKAAMLKLRAEACSTIRGSHAGSTPAAA